ncbi:MAG: hypothetical protein PHQ04_02255 [Opitutaceae bacterium]|nr:hypothetical protein [Opitutaceae bacterium]
MAALGLSIILFIFWTMVGQAIAAAVNPRIGLLRSWLLAPSIGLATIVLSLMVFNQAGCPLRLCAWPLTLGWSVAAGSILYWRKPSIPWRAMIPFSLAACFAWLWTGWPALRYGFNWVSYANDDMANYCLAAERFADRGFYDLPTNAQLNGGDFASTYWYMHVSDMMRFGSEHILAWVVGLTGLKATQLFMPVILALALTQVFSTGALVLHRGKDRGWAMAAAWLLAVSPLFMLGTLYQLIAQVGGLALLLAAISTLTRDLRIRRTRDCLRQATLPAILCAALCVYYPEVTPFAVLTVAGVIVVRWLRQKTLPTGSLALAIFTLAGVTLLLRHNLLSYTFTFVKQFTSAVHENDLTLSLFPFFLLPTGFANLFGWMPIAYDYPEPAVTLSIVAGMGLSVAILWGAIRESVRGTPVALLLLVQMAVAVRLFTGGNDFGLYKLAMFMQPALTGTLAWWALRLPRTKVCVPAIVVICLATTAPTALHYVNASLGLHSGGITELRYASKLGIRIPPPEATTTRILGATENVVAAKFAASELRGHDLALVSRNFFEPVVLTDYRHPNWALKLHPHYSQMEQTPSFTSYHTTVATTRAKLWFTEFVVPAGTQSTEYFLSLAPQLSLFNKFGVAAPPEIERLFVIQPTADLHNRLIFVHSGRGNHYYLGDRRRIALFQQEPDRYAPGHDCNGLGRFTLLRVERPTPEIYLRIAATRTLLYQRTGWNARAKVHGAEDLPLGAVGHGAFNRIIGPLKPQWHDGVAYLAIDFGEIPQTLRDRRQGLKALYNRQVPLDFRRIVGWGRDISALSPEVYQQLVRPVKIAHFPEDLATAEALEFSGAYEDGWLSPASEFVLGPSEAGGAVLLRGFVPELPGAPLGRGTLQVTCNGRKYELPTRTGCFDWLLPVEQAAATTRLALRFTAQAALPNGDERPVSAKLELLEILPAGQKLWDFTGTSSPRLAATGVDQDGWMERRATVTLPSRQEPRELVLRLEYPGWSGSGTSRVELKSGGQSLGSRELRPGGNELHFTLPAESSIEQLELGFEKEYPLPAPDNRQRAARLLTIELRAKS